MTRGEGGNAAAGCALIAAAFVVLFLLLGSCLSAGENPYDDGDDSNDCYYTEPIPHYDECR